MPALRLCLLALALALPACRSTEMQVGVRERQPVVAGSFGGMSNVSVCGSIWIGGGAEEADLELALRRGVTTVIDVSSAEERARSASRGVEAACRRLGLEHFQPAGLDSEEPQEGAVDLVLAKLEQQGDRPVLMFCESGRRAATFLAIYRSTSLGVEPEVAIAEARRSGMRRADEAFVRAQVARLGGEEGGASRP
jgi:uncharacterized protein (TIGR01244 family)